MAIILRFTRCGVVLMLASKNEVYVTIANISCRTRWGLSSC